jgi:hypothetical protein
MFAKASEHPRRHPSAISISSANWASEVGHMVWPVVLSACQETELAWEQNGNGLFTSAIIRVLRSEKGRGITFSNLIKAISPLAYGQRPRLDVENSDQLLWF